MEERRYLTVSALTKYIKYKLETDEHLSNVLLRGEISNFTRHSRGHLYFSLKDENASIRAVMFAGNARMLNFEPKEGDKVLVSGNIDLYEPQGSYSIVLKTMELDGIGELYLAYEKLKAELEKKGYFKEERKKKIPLYPNKIGVVTSPTGAAIQDILNTIGRRYPLAEVIIYPALVQGEEAKKSIASQIKKANIDRKVDVLIVGRGGGSIEDLWAFNELELIEAIYNSKIPIISAVGHETDFTIADFVSDLRAPTPTAAAEMATPNKENLLVNIEALKETLLINYRGYINEYKIRLLHLDERLENEKPIYKLENSKIKLNELNYSLKRNYRLLLENFKYKVDMHYNYLKKKDLHEILLSKEVLLSSLIKELNHHYKFKLSNISNDLNINIKALENLNPTKLMDLGYSMTLLDGKRVSSIKEIKIDDIIDTKLKDGSITSKVIKKGE